MDKLNLYDILLLIPPKIIDKKEMKISSPESKASEYLSPVNFFKWPEFKDRFNEFKNEIKCTSKKQNRRIYSKVRFYSQVSSGSEFETQLFHQRFLNEIFEEEIFYSKKLKIFYLNVLVD